MTNGQPNGIVHVPRRFVAEEWGGTETVILEIARRQQRAGARPEILTSMALATRRAETIGGVPVRRFPYAYPFSVSTAPTAPHWTRRAATSCPCPSSGRWSRRARSTPRSSGH